MKEKLVNCEIIIEIELIDKIIGGNQFYEIFFTAKNKEKYKIAFDCVWDIRSSIENAYIQRKYEFQDNTEKKSSVLIIQDSRTIKQFEKQVSGTRPITNLKNYIIYDEIDTVIEILTEKKPDLITIA